MSNKNAKSDISARVILIEAIAYCTGRDYLDAEIHVDILRMQVNSLLSSTCLDILN
jgi:hypothetical protein